MIEVAGTLTGIAFGAIGAWIGLSSYVRQLRDEWKQKLEAASEQQTDSRIKAYAAERDFQHIKRNFEQCTEAIKLLHTDIDQLDRTLIEIKAMQANIQSQINGFIYQQHPHQ